MLARLICGAFRPSTARAYNDAFMVYKWISIHYFGLFMDHLPLVKSPFLLHAAFLSFGRVAADAKTSQ